MPSPLSNDTTRRVQQGVEQLLVDFRPDPQSAYDLDVQKSVYLARQLQIRATALQTPAERRQQAELDRMIQSPGDKATLMQLTDQAFRSRLPHRSADQMIHILDVQGIPRFFSALDRTLLKGFQSFGAYLPGVAMPFVKEKMQEETANVVLPAEEEHLRSHLNQRRQEGVRMNVNFLGEALLGEHEAQRRLKAYLQALGRPEIEVISIKISTLYSQISALAREHTVCVLCDRMELLYRAAAKNMFCRHDGNEVSKFVYLDMEEYRDLEITAEVFMRTLDRPGLEQVRAGIALQAYIPDSFLMQKRLTQWARQRVDSGGAPMTVRVVKGANMEMERVEASRQGWPQAPYLSKLDTDANYKRMLKYGMQPENLPAVWLGIASHNLFTLAYGLVLGADAGVLDKMQFEMLEGMASHQRRALFELSQNMLLYAPACRQEDFINAIGYLVRRLDENTGRENFLRHAFSLQVDSEDWNRLETAFLLSFDRMKTVAESPRRTQKRNSSNSTIHNPTSGFQNSPDTDWSLPHNGRWAQQIVERWLPQCDDQAADVPLVIAGKEIWEDRKIIDSIDPSRPEKIAARYRQGNEEDVEQAIACAHKDPESWRNYNTTNRRDLVTQVANQLTTHRADLLGAMLAEGGKTLAESDPEISEAIDFCRFYAHSAEQFDQLEGLQSQGKGVVVVVSPWNFPLAIPCGGIAAALAAGNTVILKPASDTVLIARRLCECFWQAGIPKTALQFLPCSGSTLGQQLVTHDAVDAVILTGGTETALRMLAAKPTLRLLAETGGKNATIVTALADRDQVIKNVLHSAFGHSGQKCSATSLLVLEEEVYHDAKFRDSLCDAIESLHVGSAWQLHSKLGPLIRPPSGVLERALKELEPGESWAVMPRLHVDGNPHLVSPGVKWGVQPGSITHGTEFFGPLLGVMCARDLHEAIDLVNATGYGLTSGLESLDDREHQLWQDAIRAGNLYINRPTTGAIVQRQPFGGLGHSAIGPGIKAGGPNYIAPLTQFKPSHEPTAGQRSHHSESTTIQPRPKGTADVDLGDTGLDDFCEALLSAATRDSLAIDSIEPIIAAIQSCEHWMEQEFSRPYDSCQLIGEDNFHRYRPIDQLHVRVHPQDSMFEVFVRAVASRTAGCRTVISTPPEFDSKNVRLLDELTNPWAGAIEFIEETDATLAQSLLDRQIGRVRYAHPDRVPTILRTAAAQTGQYLADSPVLAHGRIELLWYFQEQNLSHVYHRYGNLGRRAIEQRALVS